MWIVGTGMHADGTLSSAALCNSADNSASNAVTNRLNIASKHTNNCPAIYRFLFDTQFDFGFALSRDRTERSGASERASDRANIRTKWMIRDRILKHRAASVRVSAKIS